MGLSVSWCLVEGIVNLCVKLQIVDYLLIFVILDLIALNRIPFKMVRWI